MITTTAAKVLPKQQLRIFSSSVRKQTTDANGNRTARQAITVNNNQYTIPNKPVVGICLDGSGVQYHAAAIDAGLMPFWKEKFSAMVSGVFPSFTNPNNAAMITGTLPKDNGICGNYFLNDEGQEVMMNGDHLWNKTIFEVASQETTCLTVTSKNKLQSILAKNLQEPSFGVSVEKLYSCPEEKKKLEDHIKCNLSDLSVPKVIPHVYDVQCAIYTLQLGTAILEKGLQDGHFLPMMNFFSTTDYMQHKYGPETDVAKDFYRQVDEVCAKLDSLGVDVVLTADHGMSDKTRYDGSPKIVYLQKILDEHQIRSAVILPITDPYVVHHGALGGFATIYLEDEEDFEKTCNLLRPIPGVYTVLGAQDAAEAFDLPIERIGDLVVFGTVDTVLGVNEEYHDLTHVQTGLRSHGGIDEAEVPMLLNFEPSHAYQQMLTRGNGRSFHIFNILCNGKDPTLEHLCPYQYKPSKWQYIGGRV